MKLFTIGPVEMYPRTREIGGQMVPYFRTKAFSTMMLETDAALKQLLGASEASKSVYLTVSGSGAMEAVVMNCLSASDRALVIVGGSFGARFAELCALHGVPYTALTLREGETLTVEHLAPFTGQGYTALLVNLHETSTGQLYDVNLLADFCRANQLYFLVDAISTFLCDPYAMDASGIDATIISSQKGLCLPPGISVVVLSERIVREKVLCKARQSLYFDFRVYIENFARGQTPFTPAVGILVQLHDMVLSLLEEGLATRLERVQALCRHFRTHLSGIPVHLPEYPLSNAITPLCFERKIAMELFQYLQESYGFYVNPTGGAKGSSMLRVAHVGDLRAEDNLQLIEAMRTYFKNE